MARRKIKLPKTLWDKVREFDEDLAVTVNSATDESLKGRLVNLSKEDDGLEDAKSKDSDLISLREQLTTANQTYSVPLKQNKLRRKLILQTLQERGKL